MANLQEIPAYWTEPERWAWEQIAAGELADLSARDPDNTGLNPHVSDGWGEHRRLSSKFLENILTQKAFVEATTFRGVRIIGALIDDAPINLAQARLQHPVQLKQSRLLTDVECAGLRVDGGLSLEGCFFAEVLDLGGANIRESVFLWATIFNGGLNLGAARIGHNLVMEGSTFEGSVSLNGTSVSGSVTGESDSASIEA